MDENHSMLNGRHWRYCHVNDNCDSICDVVRAINELTLIDCNPNLLKMSQGELNTSVL